MNECCRDVIRPSLTLKRMIVLLKLNLYFHLVIISFDMFVSQSGYYILLLLQMIMYTFAMCTKHFGYLLTFVIFLFVFIYSILRILVAGPSTDLDKDKNEIRFCLFVFLLVYEFFCVFLFFQVYKRAKHEYRIQYGYIVVDDDVENNNNENDLLMPFQEI